MEWLCLTCQMQRALPASESVEPPLMKPQASPNKVSKPSTAANQKKSVIATHKAELSDKNDQGSPTTGAPKSEDLSVPVSASSKQEKTGSLPIKEAELITVSSTKEMTTIVSDFNKPPPASPVTTDNKSFLLKKKDITQSSSPVPKEIPEKTEDKAKIIQKSADKPIRSINEMKSQQALNTETDTSETSIAKSAPPAQATNQDSEGLPGKVQVATSKTTEVMTGKMLGFGSSLFSSASTLITSAVQESRTTQPSSRKMSAPARVADKKPVSEISPKSSPSAPLKTISSEEAKVPPAQEPLVEKTQDQPQQTTAPPLRQAKVDKGPPQPTKAEVSQTDLKVGQSTCPLCKADLNVGSKDLLNFDTCTECKTTVCNKCGFNPMPSVKEVIQ